MTEAINTEQGNSVHSPPSGFKLRWTLNGHFDNITRIAWAADGKRLASASKDHKIQIWNTESGELVSVLEGHTDTILDIAWAPNVGTLASVSSDKTIKLWNTNTGRIRKEINVKCDRIVWSPDGKTFVTGEYRFQKLRINAWNASTGRLLTVPQNSEKITVQKITNKSERVYDLADKIRIEHSYTNKFIKYYDTALISEELLAVLPGNNKPDNLCNLTWLANDHIVALDSNSNTFRIIDSNTMNLLSSMQFANTRILSYAFSPNSNNILAIASQDGTIIALELLSGKIIKVLEGHADAVTSVTFSFDGQFLASKSLDDSVRIWRCETWETIAILPASTSRKWNSGLAFNPKFSCLATTGEKDAVIHIWELDFFALSGASLITSSVHYANAKVVLVGDTGVGKSGIGLVLSGEPFKPTESTHGRRVWTFERRGVVEANRVETHETLLWDLAGQPGYRLIHQLHLNEIAIALVIFDTRSETDPFAGVRHWDRALTQAQRFQTPTAPPKKNIWLLHEPIAAASVLVKSG